MPSSGLRDTVSLKGQSPYRAVCALISIKSGGHKLAFRLHSGGAAAASHYGSETQPKLPGTIVLVIVFFVAFALYHFIISVGASIDPFRHLTRRRLPCSRRPA